jgi:acyl-CoA hydrolase
VTADMASILEIVSAAEAVTHITSGDRVYLHEVAMIPHELVEALVTRARSGDLTGIETVSLHTEGPAPHVDPDLEGNFRHNTLFIGSNVGRADYTPIFLSGGP